ncbi:hypothetical protein SDC9_47223 [bioreactor metagenome]|uniref:Uncharacterized protein n=1 Tax=bioreactor metagenome TaxID=1076179 RepID=A0A644WAZ1_9ZZZZ
MTHSILSTDGDHESVEVRLERLGMLGFETEFTLDRIDYTIGCSLCSLFGGFNYLGNCTVVLQKPHAVTDEVDVLVIGALHIFIDEFSADLAIGKRKLLAEFRSADTAGPDEGFCLNDLSVLCGEAFGIDLGDQGVELNLNALFFQVFYSLCPGFLRKHVQNASQCFCADKPAFLLEVNAVFLAQDRQPFSEFTHQLDAGESTAGNHEGKHLSALFTIGFPACILDNLFDMTADAKCILKTPQVECVLLDTGYVEVGGGGTCPDDQLVISVACTIAFECLVLEIDVDNGVLYDIDHFAGENAVEGYFYGILFNTVTGDFMQLSHENVVTVLVDQGYFNLVLMLLECFVQGFCSVYSGVSPAQYHNLFLVHGSFLTAALADKGLQYTNLCIALQQGFLRMYSHATLLRW